MFSLIIIPLILDTFRWQKNKNQRKLVASKGTPDQGGGTDSAKAHSVPPSSSSAHAAEC